MTRPVLRLSLISVVCGMATAQDASGTIGPLTVSNGGINASAGSGTATVFMGSTDCGTANITTTIGNSVIFGAMLQGSLVSYPEKVTAPYAYKIYHGGDVEDERDPTPSMGTPSTCYSAAPNTVSGCYVIIEDNDAAWAYNDSVLNTNHISARWIADRQAPYTTNPYAFVTGLEVDLGGPGGGAEASYAVELEAGVPAAQISTLSTGLLNAPNGILLGEINPFASGLTMLYAPVGSTAPGFAGHQDLLGVGKWYGCASATGYCSVGTGSGVGYYQDSYRLLDQVPDPTSGGLGQTITVHRAGTLEFNNTGTVFDRVGNGPMLTTPSLATGDASSNDLAGELSLTGVTTATYTFNVTTYTHHPECFLQPQFNTATASASGNSVGQPWVTYTGTTSMTINFAVAPVAGTVSFTCIGRN